MNLYLAYLYNIYYGFFLPQNCCIHFQKEVYYTFVIKAFTVSYSLFLSSWYVVHSNWKCIEVVRDVMPLSTRMRNTLLYFGRVQTSVQTKRVLLINIILCTWTLLKPLETLTQYCDSFTSSLVIYRLSTVCTVCRICWGVRKPSAYRSVLFPTGVESENIGMY